MTKREIASLVIKLMGVFILLKSIAYMPAGLAGIAYVRQANDNGGFAQMLFAMMMCGMSVTIPLAWSLLVIFLSDKFAVWLVKDDLTIENAGFSVTKDDVMVVAISCIGLYFIIAAVPTVVTALIKNMTYTQAREIINPLAGASRWMHGFRSMVAPAVQIGLGVWLFAGSKGIVKLWTKIRS